MKKLIKVLILGLSLTMVVTACSNESNSGNVTIYSSTEDFNNELLKERLEEEFPNINIDLQYNSSGESFNRLMTEGLDSPCDIIYGLEPGPLKDLEYNLVEVSDYDTGLYIEEFENYNPYFLVNQQFSNMIIVNEEKMKDLNLQFQNPMRIY